MLSNFENNLIALSFSKLIEKAIKEWKLKCIRDCSWECKRGERWEELMKQCLCGKTPIRYLYYYENVINKNIMYVGSECTNIFTDAIECDDLGKLKFGLRENLLNDKTYDLLIERKIINEWERKFLEAMIHKRKLSILQKKCKDTILQKIKAGF
jgi:hypothetical protein